MKVIAFDTETKGLDWFDENQSAFLATWADEGGEYHADLSDPEDVAKFKRAIDEADVIVAHNLPFDAHMVQHTLGIDVIDGKVIHDTDLLSRVLLPEGQRKGERGGHGLKNLAKVYLRADAADPEDAIKQMAKNIGLRTLKQTGAYYEVYRAYPDIMTEYALQDARYTYDLYSKFEPQLDEQSRRVYDLEMDVLPILIAAEERGVMIDQAKVSELKARFEAELLDVRTQLERELGEAAFGGEGSTDALIEALQAHGIPLYKKTDTGKLATNKFALAEFAKDFPIIDQLEEYRQLERFLSTYIGAVDGVEIVHPSFRQLGAWTGRMSCTRPNMQNWPKRAGKEVRAVLVPRPGYAFVVADYEGIEARLLAYYLGDEGYRQLYRDGHDPHAYMAAQIYGGRVEDYLKGTPGEGKRGVAKNTMFAITYGAGAPRVAAMNRISPEQAKTLIRKIKSSLPNYYKLTKRIKTKIENEGHVNTIIGRKQIVGRDKSYVGLNALIQGSAADIMKLGLVNAARAVADIDGHPLMVVHDELVVEVPEGYALECQRRVDEAMVSAWDLDPPLSVESSITTTSYADA